MTYEDAVEEFDVLTDHVRRQGTDVAKAEDAIARLRREPRPDDFVRFGRDIIRRTEVLGIADGDGRVEVFLTGGLIINYPVDGPGYGDVQAFARTLAIVSFDGGRPVRYAPADDDDPPTSPTDRTSRRIPTAVASGLKQVFNGLHRSRYYLEEEIETARQMLIDAGEKVPDVPDFYREERDA